MRLLTAHLASPEDRPFCPVGRRPALVIADSGMSASLVVLDGAAVPAVGTRFRHAGLSWRIVGWRAAARAFVAEPTEQ